jgi:hypothetical protein
MAVRCAGAGTGADYRVGLLWAAPPESPAVIAFLDEMARHGFVVGKNLTLDYRAFGTHPDRLPEYAAELAGDLDGKRQDILIEAVPGLRRMAALADSNFSAETKLNSLQETARA